MQSRHDLRSKFYQTVPKDFKIVIYVIYITLADVDSSLFFSPMFFSFLENTALSIFKRDVYRRNVPGKIASTNAFVCCRFGFGNIYRGT
jgi:hypothetical protein